MSMRADLFAAAYIGLLLYLPTNRIPGYDARDMDALRGARQQHRGIPVPYKWPGMSSDLERALRRMLSNDPAKRMPVSCMFPVQQ